MPAQNGNGPTGEGPLTGRGMGQCNPNNTDGNRTNAGGFFGGGFGRRGGGFFGGGRRQYRRAGFFRSQPYVPAQSEKEVLKNQASLLSDSLDQIKKRLEELGE